MADDPYTSPYAAALLPPLTIGNEAAAHAFADQHRADIARREKEMGDVQKSQQLNVDEMTKMLDATATSIRNARSGPRTSLPLLMLGAGMMGQGDFGTQAGRGLQAMGKAIESEREGDQATDLKLAGLGLQKAQLQNAPLSDRLKYIQALQVGDISALRAIEQAQIRSQATQGTVAEKQEMERQKLHSNVLQKASAEAQKQFSELNKDNDYTQKEAQDVYRDLLRRQIQLQAGGAGITLNQEAVEKALTQQVSDVGSQTNAFPDLNKLREEGAQAGLPDMPGTYDNMGPKDRAKERGKQADAYRAEAKTWDEQAFNDKTNDERLREAENIIRENPQIMGLIAGRGWDVSPQAQRLSTILKQLEVGNVPKGQGQITEGERVLFRQAGPMMTQNPTAALATIQRMRDANNRSAEQRQFMDSYYEKYRTLDGARSQWEKYMRSPAASYTVDNGKGGVAFNEDRMPPNVYFKWQRAGAPDIRRAPDGSWLIRKDGKVEVLH